MGSQQRFLIVGAGLAGTQAAEALRIEGFGGGVVLMGDETEYPYDRPPLSKDYLQGKSTKDTIYVHQESWYAEHDIDVRLATRVAAIDRMSHEVVTDDGRRTRYDKLLLATGSSPRRLNVIGGEAEGVFYLRRVEDSEAIKASFAMAERVAIVGAGWIGLETAAAARAAGCEVTIVEMTELPLLGVLGREVAEIYATLHREHGVTFRFGAMVAEIIGSNHQVVGIRLGDGEIIDTDAVVVGIGITPNSVLAEAAGLVVDNGIVVDDHLATSDPDIFAAGDVANAYYRYLGAHLRLEHWSAALNQGPVAAANMMGRDSSYDRVPYFFSDQYDMGMEYAGFVEGGHYDEVIFRGDVTTGAFIAFWMRDQRVLAGMNVNTWDVTETIQRLVRSRQPVEPNRLADRSCSLEEIEHDGAR